VEAPLVVEALGNCPVCPPLNPALRTQHIEQSAGQCDLCSVSVDLPPASETCLFRASFSDIIIDHPQLIPHPGGF